ncbi:RNA polymerase sigma factor [Ureibacillus chungkukjangi]|uniref:RNA polymerase sigma factor n=1 Tax=Ureibacillus chungkukjangi TaxID=1202712 RepID=UPI00203C1266|nr:RNA polymerase sigma factor [Ureibacillus chungkukjangi]
MVYYTGTTDVEDLVQEVFIKAGRGLNSYKNLASPKTWLFTIARNIAIDEARKKESKINKNSTAFDERFWKQQTTANSEHILLKREEQREFYLSISKLKKKFREVLILRGIQGLSVRETAQILKSHSGGQDIKETGVEKTQTANEDEQRDDLNQTLEDLETSDVEQVAVEQKANEIYSALRNRDMNLLSNYVHSEKGLVLSLLSYLENYGVIFEKIEVRKTIRR